MFRPLVTILSAAIFALVVLAALMEVTARLLQMCNALRNGADGSRLTSKCDHEMNRSRLSFVSVHVPTHEEPASLVISTLQALAESRCDTFEVIVVDNNTENPSTWLPVRATCEALGPRFRFVHVAGLDGAKAGALNLALSLVDRRTTHVAVVDADYQVHPDFLADGVEALTTAGVDYVQFPQAYRGVAAGARGVEHELGDYFASFEGGAGRPGTMLPTGTLSVFTADALRAVGGWPTGTITEDAQIGVMLQRAGSKGLWLTRERGRGLLPVDFHGLQAQRARWAAGNLQVLKNLCLSRWPGLTFGEFVSMTVQLTAWLSFWLPLAAALAFAAILPQLPWAREIGLFAAMAILASAFLTSARMMISLGGRRVGWDAWMGAVAVKIALSWTSGISWLPALTTQSLAFRRTRKMIGKDGWHGQGGLAALSIGFLALGMLYLVRRQGLEMAACGLLGSVWSCARIVDGGLRSAARLNPELRLGPV